MNGPYHRMTRVIKCVTRKPSSSPFFSPSRQRVVSALWIACSFPGNLFSKSVRSSTWLSRDCMHLIATVGDTKTSQEPRFLSQRTAHSSTAGDSRNHSCGPSLNGFGSDVLTIWRYPKLDHISILVFPNIAHALISCCGFAIF
jgi:hypothetical protein